MTVTSSTSSTASSSDVGSIAYAGADPSAGKSTLGADDFMKLLTTQLTSQDPMDPMKDTEFISQMASFTSLEQMRTLSDSFSSFASDQAKAAAPSYIGRQVTVTDTASKTGTTTGTVTGIEVKDGTPSLLIGGKSYSVSNITKIGA
jgi:flagellar basal-body rod modification protein FlgD